MPASVDTTTSVASNDVRGTGSQAARKGGESAIRYVRVSIPVIRSASCTISSRRRRGRPRSLRHLRLGLDGLEGAQLLERYVAAHLAAGCDVGERRLLGLADAALQPPRAARVEHAPGRRVGGARDLTRQTDPLALAIE